MLTRGRDETYLVEIRAVADPAPLVIDEQDLQQDTEKAIADLLRRIGALSEQQLVDQVYRRLLHVLCDRCYPVWTDDPFGSRGPRISR